VIALLRRRRAPDFHARRLAVGLGVDRWPRRNRVPASAIARIGHFVSGVALGLCLGLVLLWLATGCP